MPRLPLHARSLRRSPRPWPAIATAVGLFAALVPGSAPLETTTAPVAPELVAEVRAATAGEPVQALLVLPNAELSGDRDEVLAALRDHAADTQAEVVAALGETATVVNRFWLTNMLLVEFPADAGALDALAAVPGVDQLIPNFEVVAPEPVAATSDVAPSAELTWGLQKIEAARVWDELGVDGSGVRIATLDTGVDITHPDLAGRMVTDNPGDPRHPGGWMEFDASGNLVASAPRDSAYHGTHVAGTIHGGATSGTAIGVAPGAEMMHGLVIPGGSGSFAQVAAGMQWAVAPVDASGNPAGRPADIVSMSLGGNGFQAAMVQPTRAIRALGSFPAFAIGNNCGTLGTASPGNVLEAVGVGATDSSDSVASFSCGAVVRKDQWTNPPADWPASWVKPDISAPGVDVYSASPGGGYRTLSGTSMATPHTAGAVALMLSAAGDLPVAEVLTVLADTGFWDDRYAGAPPDTRFGRGRINAYEATRFVALDSGVRGRVTNSASGSPVAGATVTIAPGGRTVTTGADGSFTSRLEPGDHTVTVEAFGFGKTTVNAVVAPDSFTSVDVVLTPAPFGRVTGVAKLDASGAGIPGVVVKVLGVPTDLSAVTGADGTYTINGVPAGTYRVAASYPTFRAPGEVEVTVVAGEASTADFAFGAPQRTVAIVDSSETRANQYRDVVFAPRGVQTAYYKWSDLDKAAQHATVVLGYGTLTSDYNAAKFQAFLDATDANRTGVIFTDHAYTTGNGVRQLSAHTGQPATTGANTGGTTSAVAYYEVTTPHPIFAGYAVGDRIPLDDSTRAKWVAWFDGYSGAGRQTIATLGRTVEGVMGGGIGVDQRATNRHVLLSLHGVSATRGPADWTPAATTLFLNAIDWASPAPDPKQPYYALHDLRVSPGVVKAGENVTVTAQVKNVGASAGTYTAELKVGGVVEATTPVPLAAGQSKTVTWTVDPDQLGTFTVQVGHLTGSFRVRAPRVDLAVSTVDAPGAAPVGPLAGAVVELIRDGQVRGLGKTDDAGKLSFEIPDTVGRYTLVVRKPTSAGSDAYLLHRRITVIDDDVVSFAPRVLAGAAQASSIGENFAVRANIALDAADARHTGSVFLRPTGTAPHGYRYEPGVLVATLDRYEAVTVHSVRHLEQDWFLPSTKVGGLDWSTPYDVPFKFGGPAKVSVGDVVVGADGKAAVDWSVTDAHGVPFATVMASAVRPFLSLPERAALEDVEGLVRAAAPNELKPILRLFAPDGTPVRAGSINWNARPYAFTVDPGTPNGAYRLALDVDTGGYSGDLTGEARLRVGPEPVAVVSVTDTRGTFVPGTHTPYDVRATNTGTADSGPMAWTVRVAAGRPLVPTDVVLRLKVGGKWQRVALTHDNGALTGTVVTAATVAAGSQQAWQLSLLVRTPGTYAVADTFTGTGISVTNADELVVAEPVGTR